MMDQLNSSFDAASWIAEVQKNFAAHLAPEERRPFLPPPTYVRVTDSDDEDASATGGGVVGNAWVPVDDEADLNADALEQQERALRERLQRYTKPSSSFPLKLENLDAAPSSPGGKRSTTAAAKARTPHQAAKKATGTTRHGGGSDLPESPTSTKLHEDNLMIKHRIRAAEEERRRQEKLKELEFKNKESELLIEKERLKQELEAMRQRKVQEESDRKRQAEEVERQRKQEAEERRRLAQERARVEKEEEERGLHAQKERVRADLIARLRITRELRVLRRFFLAWHEIAGESREADTLRTVHVKLRFLKLSRCFKAWRAFVRQTKHERAERQVAAEMQRLMRLENQAVAYHSRQVRSKVFTLWLGKLRAQRREKELLKQQAIRKMKAELLLQKMEQHQQQKPHDARLQPAGLAPAATADPVKIAARSVKVKSNNRYSRRSEGDDDDDSVVLSDERSDDSDGETGSDEEDEYSDDPDWETPGAPILEGAEMVSSGAPAATTPRGTSDDSDATKDKLRKRQSKLDARAEERRQRRLEFEQRVREQKEAKLRQQKEEEEREAERIRAEKEAIVKQRKLEREQAEKRKQELERQKKEVAQQMAAAAEHHRLQQMRRGWRPWRRLMQRAADDWRRAVESDRLRVQRTAFREWRSTVLSAEADRVMAADQLYQHCLVARMFRRWVQLRQAAFDAEATAEVFCRVHQARWALYTWRDTVRSRLEERRKKADWYTVRRVQRECVRRWCKFVDMHKNFRRREERKDELRAIVKQMLPDFEPIRPEF